MTRKEVSTLVAVAVGAAVLLAACGGSGQSSGSGQSAGGGARAVSIKDFAYAPPSMTVGKGTSVVFMNEDTTEHTATADGGAFDTGSIGKGQTKTVTLQETGTFSYVCTFHPFMHGTITVK